jgi:type VI secretion system protein ImpL
MRLLVRVVAQPLVQHVPAQRHPGGADLVHRPALRLRHASIRSRREIARWITIAAIFVLWLVLNLLRELRERRRRRTLTEGIAEQAPDPNATASAEEIALLSDRLKEALKTLKKAKGSSGSKKLSQLPWYMFIGPPGSGKTTALINCGLNFPLAEGRRRRAARRRRHPQLRLVVHRRRGADRHRRPLHHPGQPGRGRQRLLARLPAHCSRSSRSRQPINGVLVAISLVRPRHAERGRAADARAGHPQRHRELQDELGVRMPVYVLFTKADLIFRLQRILRQSWRRGTRAVWGATLPFDVRKDEEGAVAGFPAAFDALLGRLNDRLMRARQTRRPISAAGARSMASRSSWRRCATSPPSS